MIRRRTDMIERRSNIGNGYRFVKAYDQRIQFFPAFISTAFTCVITFQHHTFANPDGIARFGNYRFIARSDIGFMFAKDNQGRFLNFGNSSLYPLNRIYRAVLSASANGIMTFRISNQPNEQTASVSTNSDTSIYIGDAFGGERYCNSTIYGYKIYDRQFNSSERQDPDSVSDVPWAHHSFDERSGLFVPDTSGNGLHRNIVVGLAPSSYYAYGGGAWRDENQNIAK